MFYFVKELTLFTVDSIYLVWTSLLLYNVM